MFGLLILFEDGNVVLTLKPSPDDPQVYHLQISAYGDASPIFPIPRRALEALVEGKEDHA